MTENGDVVLRADGRFERAVIDRDEPPLLGPVQAGVAKIRLGCRRIGTGRCNHRPALVGQAARYSSRPAMGRPSLGCRERICVLTMIASATIPASSGDCSWRKAANRLRSARASSDHCSSIDPATARIAACPTCGASAQPARAAPCARRPRPSSSVGRVPRCLQPRRQWARSPTWPVPLPVPTP